jgi:hypothetical protein
VGMECLARQPGLVRRGLADVLGEDEPHAEAGERPPPVD